MNQLQLIKSDKFGENECDIYSDGTEMFMTIDQIANCLEYSNGRKGIENLITRNEYLKDKEFSVTLKLRATDGKQYDTRVFTEDGIYEVTMLSRTEKAKQFRAWVRKLLKSIRAGKAAVISTDKSEAPEPKPVPEEPTGRYYPEKATSIGEIVNLIKILREIMKEQKCPSVDIARMTDKLCEQFGIKLHYSFVNIDALTASLNAAKKPRGLPINLLDELLNVKN